MKIPVPPVNDSLLLRTDFSSDQGWADLCDLLRHPVDGFEPGLFCVSDPDFAGLTASDAAALAGDDGGLTFAFLADAEAINGPEHSVLAVDLSDDPGRSFRVAPWELGTVQANLEIANMDFAEFADAAGDGVFRGFPKTE
jgi:hypothetical protein